MPNEATVFGRMQTGLAVGVQLVTLGGAISFIVAVMMNSAVFSRWGLNFLQIATPGEVVSSGLEIMFRMWWATLVVAAAFLAAFYLGPPRAPRNAAQWIAAAVCALVILLVGVVMLTAMRRVAGLNEAATQLSQLPLTTEVVTGGGPADPWPSFIEMDRRFAETVRIVRETDRWGRVAALSGFLLQIFVAVASGAYLASVGRKKLAPGGLSGLRLLGAVVATCALAAVPWAIFDGVTRTLAAQGYVGALNSTTEDCDASADNFEPGELLWMGERALVIRCLAGDIRLILSHDKVAVGDYSAIRSLISVDEAELN